MTRLHKVIYNWNGRMATMATPLAPFTGFQLPGKRWTVFFFPLNWAMGIGTLGLLFIFLGTFVFFWLDHNEWSEFRVIWIHMLLSATGRSHPRFPKEKEFVFCVAAVGVVQCLEPATEQQKWLKPPKKKVASCPHCDLRSCMASCYLAILPVLWKMSGIIAGWRECEG